MTGDQLPPADPIPLVFVIALDPDALECVTRDETDLSPEANPAAYARALRITSSIVYFGAAGMAFGFDPWSGAVVLVACPLIVALRAAADTIARGGRVR